IIGVVIITLLILEIIITLNSEIKFARLVLNEVGKQFTMNKTFRDHFFMLYKKLKAKENFAFLRFSDGELRIMQNQTLILANDYFQIGSQKNPGTYALEDHKEFIPERDGEFRDKLMAS